MEQQQMVTLKVDGKEVQVPKGSTILEAAKKLHINIPTLCYHPELTVAGACRVCVCEVKGGRALAAACVFPVNEGMEVFTNTPKVLEARRNIVELLLANHPADCLKCQRNLHCELQKLSSDFGVREVPFEGERKHYPLDENNPSLIRDQSKCVLCGRCIRACSERQGMDIYAFTKRGFNTMVTSAFDRGLDETNCTYCGQCSSVCPTGAIVDRDDTKKVWKALSDPTKHVVVQTAPAVRVALGEEFGLEPGTAVTGQMVSALRKLGFNKVFDTDFTADLTIIEEGSEFIKRFTEKNSKMPMITSCSPGWVNFAESHYPDLLDHLSSAKSPQAMFGTLSKTYYAEKTGIDPKNIVSVSIMPCTAKKDECRRPQLSGPYGQDVDIVLTTREIARMIKEAGIDLLHCENEEYDAPFGITTGAGVIFGVTGGVLEAALRTVAFLVTGQELPNPDMLDVRGLAGIREHTYTLKLKPEFKNQLGVDEVKVRVAVVHTLSNARKMMEMIRAGEAPYDLIEIMACPGGCIGGGGQPTPTNAETRKKRIQGTYNVDGSMPMRKSHENPAIWELYKEWLGQPLGEKSHHYLHTHYSPQKNHCR